MVLVGRYPHYLVVVKDPNWFRVFMPHSNNLYVMTRWLSNREALS
jgi:hypothetical protein